MATSPQPITRRPKRQDPLMGKSGRDVLALFGRYHYLTSRQVSRARGWESFHQYAQKQLTELTRAGYLVMENWLEKSPPRGNNEYVWSLTEKGRSALRDMDVPVRPRIKQDHHRAQRFINHTHAVGDVLIACDLAAQQVDGLDVLELWHEQDLQRRAGKVVIAGRTENLVFDGLVAFGLPQGVAPVAFEIDMGTEDRLDKWLPKVRRLIAYNQGPFQGDFAEFGYKGFQVAVYVRSKKQPSPVRTEYLLRWTEEELERSGKKAWGPFFRFSPIDPRECDPGSWITAPHWVSPFDRSPRPLLEVAR